MQLMPLKRLARPVGGPRWCSTALKARRPRCSLQVAAGPAPRRLALRFAHEPNAANRPPNPEKASRQAVSEAAGQSRAHRPSRRDHPARTPPRNLTTHPQRARPAPVSYG